MRALELDLSHAARTRLLIVLSSINVVLGATTGAFIYLWEGLPSYSAITQRLIADVLVQGHLATENVVAAWYSSMLLLAVALAALAAFALDRRSNAGRLSWGWPMVAVIFAGLSLDEIGSLHERIGMMPALSPSGDRAVGWVYVLAIPIMVVGLFVLGFAAFHVRRVPAAFRWMAVGVVLFLSNPAFELVEMHLIHGVGADATTWQRTMHDILVVLEEGVLELFGILCFLAGALSYIATVAGPRVVWRFNATTARRIGRAATATAIGGVFGLAWVVSRLPGGDTGIPSNWFPAALWFVVALALVTVRGRMPRMERMGWAALALSAFCGAALYLRLPQVFSAPIVAAFSTALAGWALEAAMKSSAEIKEEQGAPWRPTV